MTNREMLKAIFPEAHIEVLSGDMGALYFDWEWLDAQYVHDKPKRGRWLRMSELSEEEDDRYQCSYCRNVVHYKDKTNLLAFNGWCGRCGSYNRCDTIVQILKERAKNENQD